MDIEEVFAILKGATRSPTGGASFDNTLKWFTKCGIIDNKTITEHLFIVCYERIHPARGELNLTQMICLFGALYRHSHISVPALTKKFLTVKDEIIDEIKEYWRETDEDQRNRGHSFVYSYHGSEENEDVMVKFDF